jgi:hypothetical protein
MATHARGLLGGWKRACLRSRWAYESVRRPRGPLSLRIRISQPREPLWSGHFHARQPVGEGSLHVSTILRGPFFSIDGRASRERGRYCTIRNRLRNHGRCRRSISSEGPPTGITKRYEPPFQKEKTDHCSCLARSGTSGDISSTGTCRQAAEYDDGQTHQDGPCHQPPGARADQQASHQYRRSGNALSVIQVS